MPRGNLTTHCRLRCDPGGTKAPAQMSHFVFGVLSSRDTRYERMPDVPTIFEIFDQENVTQSSRRVADVILAAEKFGRPIVTGPGVAPDHVRPLRRAFDQALKDPELLAEAQKQRMDVDPESGENLERLAKRVLEQPPEVIARVKKVLGN